VQIYFADPHSPWQRGSDENTNGPLRQYVPEGSDLSIYRQDDLDAIALSLNTRPRETLGWKSPLVVYTEHMAATIASRFDLSTPVLQLVLETAVLRVTD
jgi:IS30 family transposase